MAKIKGTLLDNSQGFKVVEKIKQLIKEDDVNQILIATGYWDIQGTALIAGELSEFLSKDGKSVKLLIGKDPTVFESQLKELKREDLKSTSDVIKIRLTELEPKEEYSEAVSLLQKHCGGRNPKFCIHTFKNPDDEAQFFHSKCWIFAESAFCEGKADSGLYAIMGSSNFTQKGLEGNSELNFLEESVYVINACSKNTPDSKGYIEWFREKWANSSDWTKEFLLALNSSPVGKMPAQKNNEGSDSGSNTLLSPYENYIKLLQDKFGMITDANFKNILKSYLPQSIRPLEYQLNAVQQCYSYMLQHGGFALGDVVGLGKTIVGILLLKYYIDVSVSLKKSDKVLIIVPPAIKSSWIDTIKKFDEKQTDKIMEHVDFLTTGSLNHLYSDFSEEEISDAEDSEESEEEFELTADDKKQISKELDSEFGDLSQKQENYGLILIDESHKFRNSNTNMYIALTGYLDSVNARTGYYPFIGLLSATLQNNTPRDIQNQIYLFEHEPKDSSFEKVEGRDLEHFFAGVNAKYATLIHSKKQVMGIEQSAFSTDENTKKELIALSKEVREKVLSDILVRRTRADIKKRYSDDLKFPAVHGPENLYYTMDKKLARLFYDTMNMIAPKVEDENVLESEGLGYYRYRATMFLQGKYDKVYSGRNMTAMRSSNQLARIMQILLVKRLESSFEAFKESLRNFQRYTQNMITMWEHDTIFICPQIDVNKELNIKEKQAKFPDKAVTLETCFDDIRKKIEKLNAEGKNQKKQNAEYTCEDFKEIGTDKKTYLDFLKDDKKKIDDLVERWNENDYDPKLDRFKMALRESSGLFCKERNAPHKLVIFSEAISTVKSLSRAVENITGKEPLVITAANRDEMENVIKANFDANCDKEKQADDYDVIITTEVLAEGINLHRANSILNYDTPWNATRLIQRIGRVNRIGSENKDIYVYNFYPSAQGDEQINLVQNAYTKLQSFHTMFGEDAKIFSQDEELNEGNFEAIVDGEESPQEKYIAELKKYRDSHKERFDFITGLENGEEKCLVPLSKDSSFNSYFAIKVKDKYGSVYVKVSPDLQASVISYMEMFDNCKCDETAVANALPQDTQSVKEKAFLAYHTFEAKLIKAKNAKVDVTQILQKASKWISSKKLSKESMSYIGTALKSVKNGNNQLAKRLNSVLDKLDHAEEQLIPITSSDIVEMIKKELGNIAIANTRKDGEAYIFAGFYL